MSKRFSVINMRDDCFKIGDSLFETPLLITVHDKKTAEMLVLLFNSAHFCDFCSTELVSKEGEYCVRCEGAKADADEERWLERVEQRRSYEV